MTTIPAWQVTAWQPVFTTTAAFRAALHEMRHLGTSVSNTTAFGAEPRSGQTVWGTTVDGRPVGIAWDWGEVCDGVVALSDPMMVVSNLCLLDDDGVCLDEDHRVLTLNALIHELPWQGAVSPPRATPLGALAA